MEVNVAVPSELRKQAQSPISSHHDEIQGDDTATDENGNDSVIQQSKGVEEASESPNSKAFRELVDDPPKYFTHVTPTKASVKLLERPQSSGDDVPASMQYKMTVPAFRQVQIKRPCVIPAPSKVVEPQLSTEEHLPRPATRGKDTATAREQDQAPAQVHFNFAPNQLSPLRAAIASCQPQTVLPSIEVVKVLPDDTFVGGLSQHDMQDEALTPKAKQDAQMPPPAPRARSQTAMLYGGIVKHTPPNLTARNLTLQRPARIAADALQPSEEDLLFLLMSRNREAKHREEALDATLKGVRGQLQRLHEQTGTTHQQLTAANARCARQNRQINAYENQIEDFKSRFTKFKKYANDLTQDHTDMGKTMKNIGNTTNKMIKDKAEIHHSLESLRKSTAIASGVLADLRTKITATSKETGAIQHALQLAKVEAQMTDASLQHERARNNRIESQMLRAQHTQERLRLSSTQEYRNAAGYLHEICKAIIHLNATVTKKEQPKDTPGVLQCLELLQTLKEKQGTSTTTLNETKAMVSMVSDRLLSYHTSAKEATKIARDLGGKLSEDVLSQIATSLASLGTSIGTEVNFATLHERVVSLQNQIALGTQMLNLAYDGKNASEHREKEQSVRVDKVLEQLAAANKRQESTVAITPSPEPVLDIGMLLTKSMQANSNLLEAQSKVIQQDAELRNKSNEIFAVNEKLKSLRAEFEASQISLDELEGQYQRVRWQADGALQGNIHLKEQLEYLQPTLLQAARVPQLLEDLAAKNAEISQLRSEAAKVDELVQAITGKDTELKQLQEKADRVPRLTMAITEKDTELYRLRSEAKRVPAFTQEMGQLREEISAMSPLKEKLASAEAELNGLRSKTAQFDRKNADNVLFQSQITSLTENVQRLEQQLGPLKKTASEFLELQKVNTALTANAASMQSLQEKLKASHREVGTLKRETVALQLTFGDYDQMKNDLGVQKDVYAKQVAYASGLQSRLDDLQARADQVPDLQGQVCELSQKCGSLNQHLTNATKVAEECRLLKNNIEQKNNEIASLKSKLKNIELQQEDDESSTRASNHVQRTGMRPGHDHEGPVIGDSQEKAEMNATDTNGPRQVADSQPQSNRPSSSSESMLLEQFEAAEELLLESEIGQETETPLSQRRSHKNATHGVEMCSRRLRNGLSSHTLEDVPPDFGRLRSGISSQVIEESQSQEQQPSTPILASSSPAGPRNLPNSGIKRPRLDPIEATPATQPTKRLKRTPANLEVKTTRPPSFVSTQGAELERPARASLPTGSRRGSVIGANTPTPGKAGGRKTTRKGSRNDRYAERFSNE